MKLSPQQFHALAARRDALAEQQQKQLARRIHDDVSQKLTILALELALLNMDLPGKHAAWKNKLEQLSALVLEVSGVVREITSEVRPKVLDEFGLLPALEDFAKRVRKDIPCQVNCPVDDIPMPAGLSSGLFAAVQEIVSEIFRPQKAAVAIDLAPRARKLEMRLGARAALPPQGQARSAAKLTLLAVSERLSRLKGTVQVKAGPKGFTTFVLSVPLPGKTICKTKNGSARNTYDTNPHH